MPNYTYTARDNAGKIAKGTIEAENELEWQNEMVGNIRLERSVAKARDSVNRGEKISTPLQTTGDFHFLPEALS